MKVTPLERKMDGSELMKFIAQRLKDQEDLKNLEASLGLVSESKPEPSPEVTPQPSVPQFLKWGKPAKVVHEVMAEPVSHQDGKLLGWRSLACTVLGVCADCLCCTSSTAFIL